MSGVLLERMYSQSFHHIKIHCPRLWPSPSEVPRDRSSVFLYGYYINAFCSSYTGTTLNFTSPRRVNKCQEEQGYRGFKRRREHLYGILSVVACTLLCESGSTGSIPVGYPNLLVVWRRWMRTALIRRGGWIDTNHNHHAPVTYANWHSYWS